MFLRAVFYSVHPLLKALLFFFTLGLLFGLPLYLGFAPLAEGSLLGFTLPQALLSFSSLGLSFALPALLVDITPLAEGSLLGLALPQALLFFSSLGLSFALPALLVDITPLAEGSLLGFTPLSEAIFWCIPPDESGALLFKKPFCSGFKTASFTRLFRRYPRGYISPFLDN